MFRSMWNKSLRDYRVAILAWGLGLALFGAIDFAESTPTTLAAFGSLVQLFRFLGNPYQIQTPEGFITWRIMELIMPLAISFWPILAGARLVRGEEERGSMDVLLATPRSRTRLLLSKLSAFLIALILIGLLFALGLLTGQARLEKHRPPRRGAVPPARYARCRRGRQCAARSTGRARTPPRSTGSSAPPARGRG